MRQDSSRMLQKANYYKCLEAVITNNSFAAKCKCCESIVSEYIFHFFLFFTYLCLMIMNKYLHISVSIKSHGNTCVEIGDIYVLDLYLITKTIVSEYFFPQIV